MLYIENTKYVIYEKILKIGILFISFCIFTSFIFAIIINYSSEKFIKYKNNIIWFIPLFLLLILIFLGYLYKILDNKINNLHYQQTLIDNNNYINNDNDINDDYL